MGHMECSAKWEGELKFATEIREHRFIMDSPSNSEAKNMGPSPKELVLAGICGCTGMDIASILNKMRLKIDLCQVNGQTDTTEGHPAIFKKVQLQFIVKGAEVKSEQVMKAVTLSMTKYCGVSAMIDQQSPIVYEVFLNDQKIGQGESDFSEALKGSKN